VALQELTGDTQTALSAEDLDIVRQQFELVTQRRRTVAPSVWSEDAVLVVHPPTLDSGTDFGRDAIARWFESWFSQFRDDHSFELGDLREVGDAVLAVTTHRGRGRASGAIVQATTASVFWVRDRLVVRGELFWDDIEGARQAASRERPD
jgi:ketosteroid isomerase-like protein